ncbi:hypothetical protein EC968_007797 [Mortierella alpina]|nr:hypothetical protein EC968_007797 [Mortierella alpina]
MTPCLHQQFRHADIILDLSVRTGAEGTLSCFVSLDDIQAAFTNARHFELNGHPIPFLPELEGTRPQCIAFYPDKILDVIAEDPQSSDNSAFIHSSALRKVDSPSSRNHLISSSNLVPVVARNVEQTTMIISENNDIQQRILDLLLEAKEKDDKMLALQLEAKEKDDKMLALQLEAKEKDDKMLQMQDQALDRLASIHGRVTAILTQTYELHEYPIPRLFIVLPKKISSWDPASILNNQFRLYFLCECGEHTMAFNNEHTKIPHHIHLAKHQGYDLQRPKEFFQKNGRYMLTLLEMIKYGIVIAGFAVPVLAAVSAPGAIYMFKNTLNTISQSDVNQSIKCLQALVNNDSEDQEQVNDDDVDSFTGLESLEGADKRLSKARTIIEY